MTYSKIHKRFSERLNNPEALTNPEKYLGPNWKDVLNFWIYVDSLSNKEKHKLWQRYLALDFDVRDSAIINARDAADEVVGRAFREASWHAVHNVTVWWVVFGYATYELIAHHKLLEQNKTLLALQCCFKNIT